MHVAIIITIKNNRQFFQCVLCHLIPYFFPNFRIFTMQPIVMVTDIKDEYVTM